MHERTLPDCRAVRAAPVDSVEIITDWDSLWRLNTAWAELWQQSRRDYVLTTPEFAEISHRLPPDVRPRRLVCATVFRDGKLVLIWPFVVYRNHHLRVALPLSSEWGDYSEVLVAPTPAAAAQVRMAWQALRRHGHCDLFSFPFVRAGSRVAQLLAEDHAAKCPLYDLEAPEAHLADTTWAAYWETRSARERSGFRRKRRRLEEAGELIIEQIDDPAAADRLLDWMIEMKIVWLNKSGQPDRIRLRTREFHDFVHAMVNTLMPLGRCEVHALRQGATLLAVDVLLIDKSRVEWFVGSFNADYTKFTPGMLLKEHTVRGALEAGRDYDMRLGGGQHKHFWQTASRSTTTWRVANSVLGWGYVGLRQALMRRPDPKPSPA